MIKFENIGITYHSPNMVSVNWETQEGRFYVWLDNVTYQPKETIYKNPLVARGDYAKPEPEGYFKTRYLDVSRKANAWVIEEIMRVVRDGDMINKAKAAHAAKQAAHAAKQAADNKADAEFAEHRKYGRELFKHMQQLINDGDKAVTYTLLWSEIEALLSYAPKHGNSDA